MSEQDRLAALLERTTRERRGGDGVAGGGLRAGAEMSAGEGTPAGEGMPARAGVPSEEDRVPSGRGEDHPSDPAVVTGGDWLPPDPGRHRCERSSPRLLTLPGPLRSVNLSVRPAAVVALIVVVLVAAAVFGFRWWRAEQGSEPVPVAPLAASGTPRPVAEPGGAGAGGTAAGSADSAVVSAEPSAGVGAGAGLPPTAGATTAAEQDLLVHVAGEVERPGVVRLGGGARVQDAVDAAGGLAAGADTSRLNLARPVADGERIWVPRPGEEVPEVADPGGVPGASTGGPAAAGDDAGGGGAAPININTADQAVLEELPGVGPVTAAAIVQWRTEHGQFSTADELLEVSGIGEATLEKLRPHVTL
ncbi:helix-hairpin-helix domain-containing protein [Ornithinimicrobium cavernae]|uniref:helix-hairpin-helix domain-containing protein n=1 Tax=Ornithinimicrobium cavernae TaxID=2666047 RepID=UPI001379C028|nr:helix-hairpin-helix domain-containing protein [Ornithinimicrobium cavernae]